MALILHIDTTTEHGSVSLGQNGHELKKLINSDQKDHASWMHEAIRLLLADCAINISDLQAIAVASGPGSYTGIRVGMAAAKGFAYALSVPLITLNTLRVMAWSQQQAIPNVPPKLPACYCPMIDARRDEVFTAIYNQQSEIILPPTAYKLDESSFTSSLQQQPVIFFGSGSNKWKPICKHSNAIFQEWDYAYFNLAYLSHQSYLAGTFADLAYVQAEYLKEVYTYKKK